MKAAIRGTIVKGLIQELIFINKLRLGIAYGSFYNVKNNKSLAGTRLNNLVEQEN